MPSPPVILPAMRPSNGNVIQFRQVQYPPYSPFPMLNPQISMMPNIQFMNPSAFDPRDAMAVSTLHCLRGSLFPWLSSLPPINPVLQYSPAALNHQLPPLSLHDSPSIAPAASGSFALPALANAISIPANPLRDSLAFECGVCTKTFSHKGNLRKHMRVHTKERPYACTRCSKRFSEQGSLTRHLRVHTGEKPFGCHICGKNFSERGNLTRHIRVHTGEKPFTCRWCHKSFTENGKLSRHIKSVHISQKQILCPHGDSDASSSLSTDRSRIQALNS